MKSYKVFLILIIFVGFLLRCYNLNWDEGHFLHPDERLYVNASNIRLPSSFEELFSEQSPLNPNMFYYGSFPLYLYKVVQFVFREYDFLIIGRAISVLLSTLTIFVIYKLGKEIKSPKLGVISAFVFAFSPGSIQHAHFLTTESMLVFLLSLSLYLSLQASKTHNLKYLFLACVACSLAYSTKITGLTFFLFPLISTFSIIKECKKNKRIVFIKIALIFILSALLGNLISIYQIIDFEQFKQEQEYMQSVTYGKYKPPFVIIYEGTIPYLYQLFNILPFTFGFISLPLAFLGAYKIFKKKKITYNLFFLFAFPLLYFLWSGAWFAKFSRYYLLLFPFLVLYTAFSLEKIKNKLLFLILLLIGINGALFIKIYLTTNTRVEASNWIYQHVPNNSVISGEHWDDQLPFPSYTQTKQFKLMSLQVYDAETPSKIDQLALTLSESDYVILSSRRVYASILKNSNLYPKTANMYKKLFSGELGFTLENNFSNYPFIFSDDAADETFQSYDHPPVIILKNNRRYAPKRIISIIYND